MISNCRQLDSYMGIFSELKLVKSEASLDEPEAYSISFPLETINRDTNLQFEQIAQN